MEDERLWTMSDVARHLGASRATVKRLIAAGKLPKLKIGKAVRFKPAAVKALEWKERKPRLPPGLSAGLLWAGASTDSGGPPNNKR